MVVVLRADVRQVEPTVVVHFGHVDLNLGQEVAELLVVTAGDEVDQSDD